MKKLIVLIAAMVFLALWTGLGVAGEYHSGTSLLCSDCHTMHASQAHDYTSINNPATYTATNNLLKDVGTNALCLTCHDGSSTAPDVYGTNTLTHVRQAGALNGVVGSLSPGTGYDDWKGHTLSTSTVTPPGGTIGVALNCASCHAVHGNTSYRNVLGTITYAKGTNDTAKDVFLRGWTLGQISTNYSIDTVDFNEPTTTASAIGASCKGCHTNFHGSSADTNMNSGGWIRHPTADANITGGMLTQFQNKLYRVKVMAPLGDWGTQGTAWATAPSTLTPTCVSCHKSHGNKNPFGLIYLSGTGPITEEGDTAGVTAGMRSLCTQCHTQGS